MKLLLVGPSRRINDYNAEYFAEKKSHGYKVVSYGASARYLHNIGIQPDIFSFLDPWTIVALAGADAPWLQRRKNWWKGEECNAGVQEEVSISTLSGTVTLMRHTDLLIADLFVDNWRKFDEFGYTSKTVKENFKHIDFSDIFLNVYEHPSTCINIDSVGENNFAENCCIYSSLGKTNTDKLTCYLLPLVLYHFKGDIEEIRIVGFGDFEAGRTEVYARWGNSAANMTGYTEYKQSFAKMIGLYIDYCREQNIDIVFEDDNYYSRIMGEIG